MPDNFELNRIAQLYASYERAINQREFEAWVDLFSSEPYYRITARENFEKNLPLSTLVLSSKGMMKDRAYGITQTIFHDPYHQRNITGLPFVSSVEDSASGKGRLVQCEANFSVFRTKLDKLSEVFCVGRYFDEIVEEDGALKFAKRVCVIDSEMIPNAIIYPI